MVVGWLASQQRDGQLLLGRPLGRWPQLRKVQSRAVAAVSVRGGGGARVERARLEGPLEGSPAVVV